VPPGSIVAIPLGETPRAEVEATLRRHFGAVQVTWVDRQQLRRRPLPTLLRLVGRRHSAGVLVSPDLDQSRLRLTSLLLGLVRADTRWRVDLRGRQEAWSVGQHVARNLPHVLRHVLACGLAWLLAEPLLRLLERLIRSGTRSRRKTSRGTRPARLLYLRPQLWLGLEGGGSVAHTAGVIGGLEEAGVEVQVVSSDHLAGVTAATRMVVPEVWFDGWARELEDLAYNAAFCIEALRAAHSFHPQAIYQRHTAFNCAGAVLSRVLRLPLVLEFNSSEVWKGRYWGGLRLSRAATLVERINLRAADLVVVVSEVLRQDLLRAGVADDRIVVNPNGVDPRVFQADASGGQVRRRFGLGSKVVIGFSGTFGAWHGIPTLAAALPSVLAARDDAHWLLIGDGPLRPLVDESVRKYGVASRVVRPGMIPHAEIPGFLAACDVLVSPHGRQADGAEFFGSPTKLYEYMAAGRPIVASGIGQIAQVLDDEHSALLVPPDDARALSEAIVRLVDDACLRARLAQAARIAVEARHTWRQNAERVLGSLRGLQGATEGAAW
jgi:glycosyltransferase involved in cell wall biosynthesis